MSRVLIIGCGGVASVAIAKCCQNSQVFTDLMIASRTREKCEAVKAQWENKTTTRISTAQVDADQTEEVIALIREFQPDAVLNVALPYQDLTIMEACLATGVDYIDTANYEPENTEDPEWREIYEARCKKEGFSAYFDYSWQWNYQKRFQEAGVTALLGSGFDPGVTSVFSAYALKHYFDTIHTIDILDCNGGDHGYPFATNFNPEINLREVSAPGSYWEDGRWIEVEAMSIKREYDFPQVGKKDMYEQEMANTPDEYTRIYDNGTIRLTLPIESTYPNYVTSALTSSDIDSISVERLSGAKMAQILADYNPPYTNEAQIARLAAIKAVNVNEPVIKVTVDVKNEKYSQIKALPDTEKTSLEKIFDLNIRNDANDFKNENGELKQTGTESGDGFNITMTMNLKEIASDGQVTYYFRESTYEPIVAIYNATITMEQAIDMTFKIGVFSLNGKMDPIVDSTYSYVYLFPNYSAK